MLGVLLRVAVPLGHTGEMHQLTEVLVVGTIHGRHRSNANYSYEDVARILDTFNPDAVCVEIRPEDFRRRPYLREMHLGAVWGLSQARPVHPIDWWGPDNDREVRAKLAKQPEFQEKEARLDRLKADDPIIRAFEKKYGDFDQDTSLGYRFWNGDEYAQYFAESYRLEVEVYGDSPFNLHYVSRNAHMMESIWAAIAENPGHRIAVLTGSEHKHVFDGELARSPKVRLVSFESILPLSERPLSRAMQAFLDEDDDLLYYEDGAIKDLDEYFHAKLIPLVHGPDMDFKPEIVPERNVRVAERIVERWQRMSPSSDARRFEQAWLHFLRRDYGRAIAEYAAVAGQIEAGKVKKPFYRSETYVDLGRSYDLLGERKKALSAYQRAEVILRQDGREAEVRYILRGYLVRPYQRPSAGSP
jgi:tetratricopeptide (TPR) repeat protein